MTVELRVSGQILGIILSGSEDLSVTQSMIEELFEQVGDRWERL